MKIVLDNLIIEKGSENDSIVIKDKETNENLCFVKIKSTKDKRVFVMPLQENVIVEISK